MFTRYLLLPLLLFSPLSYSAPALPDLSSSTSTILSTEEQNQLGESLYRQLKESGQLNDDPVINRYINNLGERLLAAAPHAPHTFTFFVIDNPQINAFATFGGYVGVYSGLIRAAKNESELASVIAHEIAHVTQDHLRRAIEKSNRMGVPVTVALLAAILLGSDAPELAEAAVATALAGQQQQQLSYTRSHEREADRLGIERLSSANFDPEAMARFFSLIQQRSRYSSAYPEFLRTHPVTIERISEAKDRARQLPTDEDKTSIDFLTTQSRLTLSETQNSLQLIKELTGKRDTKSRYTLALALLDNQRYIEAMELTHLLQHDFPNMLSFLLSEADIYVAMERWSEAVQRYQAILEIFPHNRPATIALVKLHISLKEYDKAHPLLLTLEQKSPLEASEYRLLAEISSNRNSPSEMHLYQAEALILESHYKRALEELQLAHQYALSDFYFSNRIEARIEELKERTALQEMPK